MYDLTTHFIQKESRDDESDPHYPKVMEIIQKECQSIIDILNQDAMTWDIKQLITIYIPRTVGVAYLTLLEHEKSTNA